MSKENPKKAVVLLSGGVDSTTTLAIAIKEGYHCYAMSFNYGQRHLVELDAAKIIAENMNVAKHFIINLDMSLISGSALTSDIDVPKNGLSDDIPVTYVPARNTIFLSYALAWAEALEASAIFIGANAVDYSGYPDCRPEYLSAFEDMANLATKLSVEGNVKFSIKAPLLRLTKTEIIKTGIKLGVDYSLTWSCYDPQPSGKTCGECDSCRIRDKGMKEAGL